MGIPFKDWDLERILLLFISGGYLILFIHVTLSHVRGKFHKSPMWIPVISLPLLIILGMLSAFFTTKILSFVLIVLSAITILIGMIGTFFHIKAISLRTGGFNIENLMSGPPFLLPLLISIFGSLSLIVLL